MITSKVRRTPPRPSDIWDVEAIVDPGGSCEKTRGPFRRLATTRASIATGVTAKRSNRSSKLFVFHQRHSKWLSAFLVDFPGALDPQPWGGQWSFCPDHPLQEDFI